MNPIPINLAVEDELSEVVLRKVLSETGRPFSVGVCYRKGGFGYLKRMIGGFNSAARTTPFLVLTDLDAAPCAPALIHDWLPVPLNPNLLFRVAVRQIEAWVMAHRDAFAKFLGISVATVPGDVESLVDSKRSLIDIVARSPYRELKQDVVPRTGSTAKQGPNYNGRLAEFVQKKWSAKIAARRSNALRRTLDRLEAFRPTWTEDMLP